VAAPLNKFPHRPRAILPRFFRAGMILTLLCGSTAIGLLLRSRISAPSTETETLHVMDFIISFMVTIAAVVVGLLINTAMSFVDTIKHHWAMYAGQLIRLDQSMRNT
jgi:hypothetical protein